MIAYKTNMEEIPQNCKDCPCAWCHLPLKQNKYEPRVKKRNMKRKGIKNARFLKQNNNHKDYQPIFDLVGSFFI